VYENEDKRLDDLCNSEVKGLCTLVTTLCLRNRWLPICAIAGYLCDIDDTCQVKHDRRQAFCNTCYEACKRNCIANISRNFSGRYP